MRRRVTPPWRWSRVAPAASTDEESSPAVSNTGAVGTAATAGRFGESLGDRAAVVMGVALLVLFASTKRDLPGESTHSFDLLAAALLVVAGALLLLSRRFPATVAALLVGLSVVWYMRYANRLIDVPATAAFYMLGMTGDRRRQLSVGGVTSAFLLLGAVDDPSAADLAIEGVGWTAAAILCGELVRSRRLLLDHYAERTARAEAERDAEAERRVARERLRIARDVHDVLAHTVSLMSVQAEVAADAVERGADPATVRSALATLRSAGKEAMAEVRATVAVLRGADEHTGGGGDVSGEPVPTTPTPTLDRVAELVEAGRAQGLDIELTMDLEDVEVDGIVGLTAYRVVQESLTNVTRHAATSRAAVRLHGAPSGLVVEVVDDGRPTTSPTPGEPGWPGPPDWSGAPRVPAPATPGATAAASGMAVKAGHSASVAGPGFGLRGMRERVEAVRGELSYGPMPGRGWVVRATLPTKTSPSGRPGEGGR